MRTSTKFLAALLIGAGVVHTVRPDIYDASIPDAVPMNPRTVVYASGAVEVALGLAVLHPTTRRLAALASAALFVAVFPSNIKIYRDARSPRARQIAGWRLPLQLPLVLWAVDEALSA